MFSQSSAAFKMDRLTYKYIFVNDHLCVIIVAVAGTDTRDIDYLIKIIAVEDLDAVK